MKPEQLERIKLCNCIKVPAFQELFWLLSSESLSETYLPEYHFAITNQFGLYEQIKEVAKNVSPKLNSEQSLGKYAEQLIEIYLEHIGRYKILGKNIQLIENKTTLGEIDFLIQDQSDKLIHLEFAVKFYVKIIKNGKIEYLGPNLNDNWHRKIEKLTEHQIQLTDKYSRLLPHEFQNQTFDKKILVLGQLFEFNQINKTNWAISISSIDLLNRVASYFAILPNRFHWLFPFRQENELMLFEDLKKELECFDGKAMMVTCFDQERIPISWGFIMKDLN